MEIAETFDRAQPTQSIQITLASHRPPINARATLSLGKAGAKAKKKSRV